MSRRLIAFGVVASRARFSVDRTGRLQRVRQGLSEGERPGVAPERSDQPERRLRRPDLQPPTAAPPRAAPVRAAPVGTSTPATTTPPRARRPRRTPARPPPAGITGGNTSSIGNDGGSISNSNETDVDVDASNDADSDVDQDANGGNSAAINNSEDDNTSVGGDAENNCGVQAGGCQSVGRWKQRSRWQRRHRSWRGRLVRLR